MAYGDSRAPERAVDAFHVSSTKTKLPLTSPGAALQVCQAEAYECPCIARKCDLRERERERERAESSTDTREASVLLPDDDTPAPVLAHTHTPSLALPRTNTRTHRWMDSWTRRQTDRQTDKQTDRQTHTHRDAHAQPRAAHPGHIQRTPEVEVEGEGLSAALNRTLEGSLARVHQHVPFEARALEKGLSTPRPRARKTEGGCVRL
jgi:hypothetical protein